MTFHIVTEDYELLESMAGTESLSFGVLLAGTRAVARAIKSHERIIVGSTEGPEFRTDVPFRIHLIVHANPDGD